MKLTHSHGLICLFLSATLAQAQSGIGRGPVKALFEQHCAVCHGPNGEGGLGSSLIDDNWDHAQNDLEQATVIREGLPEFGMEPFADRLDERQIRSLVIYLRELKHQAQGRPPTRPVDGVHRTQHHHFRLETLFQNHAEMWGLAFAPDGRLLVTEIDGALRWVSPGGVLQPPVRGTPKVLRKGQGGMLDVALHPGFAENGWVYISYADGQDGQGMTSLMRGRIVDNVWTDAELLFRTRAEHTSNAGTHFGSRIAFRDGYVFFSMGDRGNGGLAQRLDHPNGKIFRLHDDGRIPADNPFVGKSPYPAIWSYGHRNPQALAFHPATGELWSTEHGPRGGDELNRVLPGRNYGWPVITYGMNYDGRAITDKTHQEGMEQPVWHWTPSIATCGMAFLSGEAFPRWEGDAFAGGLSGQVLERLRLDASGLVEREILLQGVGRVRDVKCSPQGQLYLILEGGGSRVVRLVPVP